MRSKNTTLPAFLLILATLLIILINSPATAFAAQDDAPGAGSPAAKPVDEPYKVVKAFCRQRRNKKDREFCMRALKSDPRSATAKDNATLLYISVDLASENTNKTREYLITLSKGAAKKQRPLITAIKDCIDAYKWGIGEINIIIPDFRAAPELASYDALLASDALLSCTHSLNRNNITDNRIFKRHKISTAYVRLCVDIAMIF